MPDSTLTTSALSLEILRREFPGYRIVREVGHGAMGIVFEAEQAGIGRRVAVKVLPPNLALRDRTVKRFLREAEAMGRLAHPCIVDVFEVGSRRELNYFSMKYVEGPPLDRVLKAGPLAVDDVVRIGVQVADALAHAHSRGVLHRDVKPANLLRDSERVVLTDFGLARPIDTADAGTMTESGDLVGTPLYMAPEQISGDAERVDGRADIWGLGVTLYELLAGRTPFTGANAQGILHAILQRDPPLLRKLRDDVPRDLEAVVLKCLEKDPGRRYATAAALREDLEAVRDGRGVSATRPRPWDPALRWVRRHPAQASVLAVAVLVAAALLATLQDTSRQLEDVSAERDAAQAERSEAIDQQVDFLVKTLETWARYEIARIREEAAAIRDETERAAFVAELRGQLAPAMARGSQAAWRPALELLAAWAPAPLDVDRRRTELEDRLIDLLEEIPIEDHPYVSAEAIEMLASWNQERGHDDERVLRVLDLLTAGGATQQRLFVRAAARADQGRLVEALELHLERARLAPESAAPRLDAARILRRMAADAREALQEETCRAHLSRALRTLARGIELAVAAGDGPALQRLLTERARCLLDLDDPLAALADLEQVLARDATDFEAFSTQLACQRALRRADERPSLQPGEGPTAAPAAMATPAGDDPVPEEVPALSIERLMPGRAELTESLETAGRDLQSIYRGMQQLLQSPEEPAADEPDGEPDPAQREGGG